MFLDINNFKSINDNFGHSQGDQSLRDMAKAIQGNIEGEDRLFHISGDEFVIIAPHSEGVNLDTESITKK